MEQYAPFLFLIIYLIYTFYKAGKKFKNNRPGQQKPPTQPPQQHEYAPYARKEQPNQTRSTEPVKNRSGQQRQPMHQKPVVEPKADEDKNPLEELLGPMWQQLMEEQKQAERKARKIKERQQQAEVVEEARKLREQQELDRTAMEKRLEQQRKREEERKRMPLPEFHPASLMEDFDPVKAVIYSEIFKRPEY